MTVSRAECRCLSRDEKNDSAPRSSDSDFAGARSRRASTSASCSEHRGRMPTQYSCTSCGLEFSVGWYHYHDFRSGYCAATLAVCTSCGAQHQVEIALEDRGPAEWISYDVLLTGVPRASRVAVLAWIRRGPSIALSEAKRLIDSLPAVLCSDAPSDEARALRDTLEGLGARVSLEVRTRTPNPNFGPTLQDKLALRMASSEPDSDQGAPKELPVRNRSDGPTGTFNLAEQACGSCGCTGTLVTEMPEPLPPCPGCGRHHLVERDSWIT